MLDTQFPTFSPNKRTCIFYLRHNKLGPPPLGTVCPKPETAEAIIYGSSVILLHQNQIKTKADRDRVVRMLLKHLPVSLHGQN